jgi:hypothetical protein
LKFLNDKQKNLIKKFPSLKLEILALVNQLKINPTLGTPLGDNCYKIRLAIASKGKGKSGGARIITHLLLLQKAVYLLTIYNKNEKENISDKELDELLKFINE